MPTESSNIDDLLSGTDVLEKTTLPDKQLEMTDDNNKDEAFEVESDFQQESSPPPEENNDYDDSNDTEEEQQTKSHDDAYTDEYGNDEPIENENIRKRLSKQAKRHQEEVARLNAQIESLLTNPNINEQAQNAGFEYDPESNQTWDQQLKNFVKNVIQEERTAGERDAQRQREAQAQAQFEQKFRNDMDRFDDFREVIQEANVHVPDPVLYATRGMNNPAAFLYAAAKRMPQELARICSMTDPYAQMMEVGRLEAKLKVTKAQTKTPKPLSKPVQDGTLKMKQKAKPSNNIDDLLADADKRKVSLLASRPQSVRGRR